MRLQGAIATYVESLDTAAHRTRRAEDRPAYQTLLADAAGLLASATQGTPEADLIERVRRHERLRSNLWLLDDCFREPESAWDDVTRLLPPTS